MKQWLTFFMILYTLFFFFQTTIGYCNEKNEIEQEPIMQSELVQAQFERINFEEIKVYWDDIVTKYGWLFTRKSKGKSLWILSVVKNNFRLMSGLKGF